jgi:dipeptidyl aminopeptidase/acylaminoacyl peptidase
MGLAWNPGTGEVWFTATLANIHRSTVWATSLSGEPRRVYSLPDFYALQDVSAAGCLFISGSRSFDLLVGSAEGALRNHTWLGSTLVLDISPDGTAVLVHDGGTTEGSLGSWVRPLDGGEAVRIADGDPWKFSPDGRWVVTTSRPVSGPPQLALVPAAGGDVRPITRSPSSHSHASFAGPDALLFVRSEGDRSEVWRIGSDGSGERSLGAPGCSAPVADPADQAFLCLGGTRQAALFVHPMTGGGGRKLYDLAGGGSFMYARWNESGKRIFAVTSDRRFLTLDRETGALLRDEAIVLPEGYGEESLLAVAFSPDARIRAYSVNRVSSRLYLSRGL